MVKGSSGVVRWINVNAFNLAGEILFKGFKCKKVVAVDQHILRRLVAVRLARVFNENARLELELFAFSYPSQFQFLLVIHVVISPIKTDEALPTCPPQSRWSETQAGPGELEFGFVVHTIL